jgi:aryl-alcohol dehydrogenase-like predicted oxidoreductase
MEYRNIGKSGLKVSTVGIGGNRFGHSKMPQEEVNRVISRAQELGINFIDTANTYTQSQSETTIGNALKGSWDHFIVATKFTHHVADLPQEIPNHSGASRYHIMEAAEGSLRRLQHDHIDLYYVHDWDDETPIEETLRALDDLIRMGKVRYIAASNFASWQLAHANLLAEVRGWTAFIAVQNHHNMFERADEREMLPYCLAHQVGYVPYFPLASGFLTGKYKRNQPFPEGSRFDDMKKAGRRIPYDDDWHYDRIEALETWAEKQGHSMVELAIAWLLAKPQVPTVISGVTKVDQLESNAHAAGWKLSHQDVEEVNQILENPAQENRD